MCDKKPLVQREHQGTLKVILIVVSEEVLASYLIQMIREETTYFPLLVKDSIEALEVVKEITPDLLLLDHRLPGTNGMTLYQCIYSLKSLRKTPALIINAPQFSAKYANEKREVKYLRQPLEAEELLSAIEMLLVDHLKHRRESYD